MTTGITWTRFKFAVLSCLQSRNGSRAKFSDGRRPPLQHQRKSPTHQPRRASHQPRRRTDSRGAHASRVLVRASSPHELCLWDNGWIPLHAGGVRFPEQLPRSFSKSSRSSYPYLPEFPSPPMLFERFAIHFRWAAGTAAPTTPNFSHCDAAPPRL